MRRFIAVVSVALVTISTPAFAQSNIGTDESGRFVGTPPLGTSPEYDAQQGGLSIPLDTYDTGGIVIYRPSNWRAPCSRPEEGSAMRTHDGSVNAACPDRTN